MTTNIAYNPGFQTTTSHNAVAQRRAIIAAKPATTVIVAGKAISLRQLLNTTSARLRQLGINEANLWSLLDDAADGQTIDPKDPELAARYGTSGGQDGAYDRAIVSGLAVHEALASDAFAAVSDANALADKLFAAHGDTFRALLALPAGAPALGRAITDARPVSVLAANWSKLSLGLNAALTDRALSVHMPVDPRLANVRYSGQAARLNAMLTGDSMASVGDSGFYVTVLQRYLQFYNPGITPRTSGTFDATMVAQVTRFQTQHGLPATGRVDAPTLQTLLLGLTGTDPVLAVAPTDPRFTIEMDLNQPAAGSDGTWKATRAWNDAERASFVTFSSAYQRACLDSKESIDCADLAIETLITFARQRGLPIVLGDGRTVIKNDSCPKAPRAVSVYARELLTAIELPLNTVPVPLAQLGPGDLGVMDWTQDGRTDFPYQHTFNVIVFDAHGTMAIYGDEGDTVKRAPLAAFNARFGTDLIADDIPEHTIIDPINADPHDHVRQLPASEWPQLVRDLFSDKGYFSDDPAGEEKAVTSFIAMIRTNANITRNGSTAVRYQSGEYLREQLTGRDLWADGAALAAVQSTINAQFNLTIGAVDHPADKRDRPSVSSDLLEVLRTPDATAALAAARAVVTRCGAAPDKVEAAARALSAAIDATRQGRRWDFTKFNGNFSAPANT